MLGRLHRYVIGEVLRLFLISLSIVTFVIMSGVIVQRLVAEGLGLFAILQLIPYGLPISLQYALPATLLFAVCSVFGRMSADNEIVATKSVGISPSRIFIPILILGLVLSPVAVWLNDIAMSWGKPGMNRVVLYSIEEIVYRVLRRDKSYQSQSGFEIAVKSVEDRWLISPMITIRSQAAGRHQTISAEKARLQLNPDDETLLIELVDYEWDLGNKRGSYTDKGSYVIKFPLHRAARKNSNSNSPSSLAMRDIAIETRHEIHNSQIQREKLAAWSSMGLAVGRLSTFSDESANRFQSARDESEKRLHRLRTEPWRRWALGFSCFFFVWFGIPLSVVMRSADYATTFGACFFPILMIYYPIFGMGLDRAKDGAWPPYSVWLCNIVLFLLGAFMMRKAYRH